MVTVADEHYTRELLVHLLHENAMDADRSMIADRYPSTIMTRLVNLVFLAIALLALAASSDGARYTLKVIQSGQLRLPQLPLDGGLARAAAFRKAHAFAIGLRKIKLPGTCGDPHCAPVAVRR
jgi:hypothetical protein